ncbi:MAG: type II methionyl aminopeptidase [Candidatus Helarchaeota archaeon]|nr:type II methionyl aminopeptidase [Candidatus Helarchaeota archaeon]
MLDDEILENYYQAGKILANALERGREKVKPGAKLIEITKFIEDKMIRDKGFSLAFPLNIGIDEITAHYSCPVGDTTIVPEKCLVKLDAGVQLDGYTTDMAVSVQVGTDEYQSLIAAAEAGLETAIKTIQAGITVGEVGATVEKVIRGFGVQPISNLSGHQMKQFQLHAGITVPNIKVQDPSNAYRFKAGDIFALEPFATPATAAGYVVNGAEEYIHSLLKRKVKNMPSQVVRTINQIWGERRSLPFSFRWYSPLPKTTLNRLASLNVIHGYAVLIEASKNPVAQAEKTVLVQEGGCEIITKK